MTGMREALETAYHELKKHDADYHHRTPTEVNSLIVDALGIPEGPGMSPERTQKAHELAEEIRELVRLGVAPEHRPKGLFSKCQDLVYLFRGRPSDEVPAGVNSPGRDPTVGEIV